MSLGRNLRQQSFCVTFVAEKNWWLDPGSNRGHTDFQSVALPTELSSHIATAAASGLLCPKQALLQALLGAVILLLALVFSHNPLHANLHLPNQTEEKRPEVQTL